MSIENCYNMQSIASTRTELLNNHRRHSTNPYQDFIDQNIDDHSTHRMATTRAVYFPLLRLSLALFLFQHQFRFQCDIYHFHALYVV